MGANATATKRTHTARKGTTKRTHTAMSAPQVIAVPGDNDTFVIYIDSPGWQMKVEKPEIIVREDRTPIVNPEPLGAGANIFRRAEPGTGKNTKYEFQNFPPECLTGSKLPLTDVIKVIPPKP